MSVTGIILAGGRGSRLGGADKAALEIGGLSSLERVRRALGDLVAETVIVANDERLAVTPDAVFIRDPEPHAGVLPALHAALAAATSPLCVLVACDMPLLNRDLLGWLVGCAQEYDAVVPEVDGRPQPMHAVYRRDRCHLAIGHALRRGDRRMISFLDGLRVLRPAEPDLVRFDRDLRSFFNVNTPEDLERARVFAVADPR